MHNDADVSIKMCVSYLFMFYVSQTSYFFQCGSYIKQVWPSLLCEELGGIYFVVHSHIHIYHLPKELCVLSFLTWCLHSRKSCSLPFLWWQRFQGGKQLQTTRPTGQRAMPTFLVSAMLKNDALKSHRWLLGVTDIAILVDELSRWRLIILKRKEFQNQYIFICEKLLINLGLLARID